MHVCRREDAYACAHDVRACMQCTMHVSACVYVYVNVYVWIDDVSQMGMGIVWEPSHVTTCCYLAEFDSDRSDGVSACTG